MRPWGVIEKNTSGQKVVWVKEKKQKPQLNLIKDLFLFVKLNQTKDVSQKTKFKDVNVLGD